MLGLVMVAGGGLYFLASCCFVGLGGLSLSLLHLNSTFVCLMI